MSQIIHIGYPKTATSWFQYELFPNILNYYTLIKHPLLSTIRTPNLSTQNINMYFTYFSSLKNIIISDEDLVSNNPDHVNPFEKAKRLKMIFPNAEIVIFIRNQLDILPSVFDQYIKQGGVLNFDKFIKSYIESGMINHWKYHQIISYYTELFGRSKVNIFLFEDFKYDSSFLDNFLTKFNFIISKSPKINRTINIGLGNPIRNIWRFLNHFTKHQIYMQFPPKQFYFHLPGLFTLNKIYLPILNSIYINFVPNNKYLLISPQLMEKLKYIFGKSNKILLEDFKLHKILKYNYFIEP